jgi:hypothetical protein
LVNNVGASRQLDRQNASEKPKHKVGNRLPGGCVGASRQLGRKTHRQNQNTNVGYADKKCREAAADWNAGVPPPSVCKRTKKV